VTAAPGTRPRAPWTRGVSLGAALDHGATSGSFGAAVGLPVYLQRSAAVVLPGAGVNAVVRDGAPAADA
jgi:hypothetical protein